MNYDIPASHKIITDLSLRFTGLQRFDLLKGVMQVKQGRHGFTCAKI